MLWANQIRFSVPQINFYVRSALTSECVDEPYIRENIAMARSRSSLATELVDGLL